MKRICLTTWRHLGDTVILSAAMHNLDLAYPGMFEIGYSGDYGEVFSGDPIVHLECEGWPRVKLTYQMYGKSEKTGDGGNMCECITDNLGKFLGVYIYKRHSNPVIFMPDNIRAEIAELPRAWICNTNCQECSTVKAWPWWNGLFKAMPDKTFILIGGTDVRDIKGDVWEFPNVIDLRGKTTINELKWLAKHSIGVISPPSAIVHIAAAFDTPAIVIHGASEPRILSSYAGMRHLSGECGVFNWSYGCRHKRVDDMRSCTCTRQVNGRKYAECMCGITEDMVIEKMKEIENGK